MAWDVTWKVFVNGNDKTSKFKPSLISITIKDKDGTAGDSCSLRLDDSNGRAIMPPSDGNLVVYLQGVKKFEGKIDKIRSRGSRSGGRVLSISAKGFDTKGKVKDGQRWHKDDATLGDALQHAAKKAGLSGIKVDPEFASIKRDYWSPDGASFLAWGQRLAREHHATFKIRGDKAVFAKRDSSDLPEVHGTYGDNLISWDIAPKTSRRRFKKSRIQYFDRNKAEYMNEEIDFGDNTAEATNEIRTIVADKDQAKTNLKARKSEADREGGEGSAVLNLTVNAQAEAPFRLSGARPGVDGQYRIVSVTLRARRSGGSTTSLELKQPKGSAGKDTRVSTPTAKVDPSDVALGNAPSGTGVQ